MSTRKPSGMAMFTMAAFSASCIGLLIFLWLSFGGALPLASQGYRFNVEFDEAVELGTHAQVEIAGVPIGTVISVGLDRRTGRARATIEINPRFAPRPADTRAILRAKTLLGETYVELSPGTPAGSMLPDGGTLPHAQVAPTVALDKIFSAFDPATRRALETWMQQSGIALTNRGQQFNTALANLYPFATNVDSVLAVLNRQSAATRSLLHDGGQVFSALGRSPAQLQGFVNHNSDLFAATAARNRALAATFRAFPAFLAGTRATIARVTRFANATRPLVDELRPAAVALNPALSRTVLLAPELRDLLVRIGPLTRAARQGFPAFDRFLQSSVPFFARLKPYLGGLVPVIDYIQIYKRELAAFFADSTASTQGVLGSADGHNRHYVRIASPINPELLTPYSTRPSSNRANPYLQPGGYNQLASGLPVFGSYLCTAHALPSLSPSLGAEKTAVNGAPLTVSQLVSRYYFTPDPSGPRCRAQQLLGAVTAGQAQSFPHLRALP